MPIGNRKIYTSYIKKQDRISQFYSILYFHRNSKRIYPFGKSKSLIISKE